MKEITSFLVGDGEKCKKCLACHAVCPTGDINFVPFRDKSGQLNKSSDSLRREYPEHMCSVCFETEKSPICITACPEHALQVVNARQERKAKNQKAVIYLYKYWGGRTRS